MKLKNCMLKVNKAILFFLILVLSLSVIGCSCGNDDTPEEQKEETSNEPYVNYDVNYDNVIDSLVKDNKSAYSIVYGENAGLAVKQAAKEIQDYVFKSTGVYLKLTTDNGVKYSENLKAISVGQNKLLSDSELNPDYKLLRNDGYFIKTKGKAVFLTGKTDRGTLYSAYEFLEKFVGVKFLAYDYTYVPTLTTIDICEMNITDNPAFNNRTFLSNKIMSDGQFAPKMRMVNEFVNIDERYGGGIGWFKDPSYISNHVHNTLSYVQPDIYYAGHKDWFFVDDGKVLDLDYSHLGITEDGHIDESLSISPVKVAVERLKTFITNSTPDIKYFMVGQQDEHNHCQCADCVAQESKYKRSGMNIRFVNAMSEAIEKWMKDEGINREIYICTFAYQYSQSAPVNEKGEPLDATVIPRDNVIVRIAPIQADNYYSMTDERQNDRTRNMFLEWSKVAKNFMIWDYHSVFSHYFGYYSTMHAWQENLVLYQKMGADYVFMQPDHTEVNDFKIIAETYVASKMLWNPKLNANELLQEFNDYYYNGISDLVNDFTDNFETNYYYKMNRPDFDKENDNTNQKGRDNFDPKYYSIGFFETQFGLINSMYEKAETLGLYGANKEKFIKRIDRLKLYPLYMVLLNYNSYYFDDAVGKKEMVSEFFTICDKLGVLQYAENKTINSLKTQWGYNG